MWATRLKLSASLVDRDKAVCSLHFRPEDITWKNVSKTKRYKYFRSLNKNALPLVNRTFRYSFAKNEQGNLGLGNNTENFFYI